MHRLDYQDVQLRLEAAHELIHLAAVLEGTGDGPVTQASRLLFDTLQLLTRAAGVPLWINDWPVDSIEEQRQFNATVKARAEAVAVDVADRKRLRSADADELFAAAREQVPA
jgi:hypothetical protein